MKIMASGNEAKKAHDMALLLREQYPRTEYAVFAALTGAKAAFEIHNRFIRNDEIPKLLRRAAGVGWAWPSCQPGPCRRVQHRRETYQSL